MSNLTISTSLNLDRSDSVATTESGYLQIESRKTTRSIYSELRRISVEEHIRRKADELYRQNSITGRQSKRQLMLYYYLACAYNETQTPYNPHYLAKTVGIPITKIQTAMCTFTKSAHIQSSKTTFKKPHDYIESQMIYTGLSPSHISDVIELIDDLLEKDEDLYDAQPQVLSAATILYFMELEQVDVPSNFRNNVNIPKSTLENMHKRLRQTHNN